MTIDDVRKAGQGGMKGDSLEERLERLAIASHNKPSSRYICDHCRDSGKELVADDKGQRWHFNCRHCLRGLRLQEEEDADGKKETPAESQGSFMKLGDDDEDISPVG
jgi:hypothetical protein